MGQIDFYVAGNHDYDEKPNNQLQVGPRILITP